MGALSKYVIIPEQAKLGKPVAFSFSDDSLTEKDKELFSFTLFDTHRALGQPVYLFNSSFFKTLITSQELTPEIFDYLFKRPDFVHYHAIEPGSLHDVPDHDVIPVGWYIWKDGDAMIFAPVARSSSSGNCDVIVVNGHLDQEQAKELFSSKKAALKDDVLFKAIILCTLYVHTGSPDIRNLKPMNSLSKSAVTGLRNKGIDVEAEYSDEIRLPVKLVSWGWDKTPLYKKEQWLVRPYFRLVYSGEGRSKSDLRWFPPSIRKRQKLLHSPDLHYTP